MAIVSRKRVPLLWKALWGACGGLQGRVKPYRAKSIRFLKEDKGLQGLLKAQINRKAQAKA